LASYIVVIIVFAGLGAGLWSVLGWQYRKDHKDLEDVQKAAAAGSSAHTTGAQSPANTGNGNTFNYQSQPDRKAVTK
jgi:hypothetical protein